MILKRGWFRKKAGPLLGFLIFLSLPSCTTWFSSSSSSPGSEFSLVFSHNINGETHPCGCRHFPLGGLPQVAGLLHQLRQKGPVLYVDSGDTFFPLPILPPELAKSAEFTAKKMVEALGGLKLDLFLPGDQDFAHGAGYLADISQKAPFTFLISNLSPQSPLKHRSWYRVNLGPRRIYLVGLLHPENLSGQNKKVVIPPLPAFRRVLKEITKDGYLASNPHHKLIVLSHSGISWDEKLSGKFPTIDWIIGAHTQDFLKEPRQVGKTRIVQVLSRNHYLGQIFPFKEKEAYQLLEVREELQDHLKPNPFMAFIDQYKTQLSQIQKEEQSLLPGMETKNKKFPAPQSCLECHQEQTEHWQKTPHALAYYTLVRVKEENNLKCLSCHTLGLSDPRGFSQASEVIAVEKKLQKTYWTRLKGQLSPVKSVRELPAADLGNHAKTWMELDQRFGVQHNFANVQCFHCHDVSLDHPFGTQEELISPEKKLAKMKETCQKCHTADQSPEWYLPEQKGHPPGIDEVKLNQFIRAMTHK